MPLWRCAWQVPLAGALLVLCLYGVGPRFEAVGCLYLALVTPELCRVDLAEHRLPNALVLPGFVTPGQCTISGARTPPP